MIAEIVRSVTKIVVCFIACLTGSKRRADKTLIYYTGITVFGCRIDELVQSRIAETALETDANIIATIALIATGQRRAIDTVGYGTGLA